MLWSQRPPTTTEETWQCTGTLAHADPNWALELLRPRVVHGGRMKCRHKPSTPQMHHELFPTNTGVMRCLAQPLRGSTTTKKASDSTERPNRLHNHTQSPRRRAHPRSPMPPLLTLTARATHARPLAITRSIGFCAIWGCISSSSSSSSSLVGGASAVFQ